MKKTIKFVCIATIAIFSLASCSGNNDGNNVGDESAAVENTEEQVESADIDFDFDGLKALTKKKKGEITSSDYDFLLKQCEVLVKKTEGMTPEESQTFLKNMSSDEFGAILVIGMSLESAKKDGKLSDDQLKKWAELEARSPQKN